MALSVVDPVGRAIERAQQVCFRPFDLGKWFVMGFCAFLAGFAQGGASVPSFNYQYRTGFGANGRTPAEVTNAAIDWIEAHLIPILVIGAIGIIVVIALWALFLWLGSRGQFMFIDNIARNRGAVADPWRKYRKEGNSLFGFLFLLVFATIGAFLAVVAGAIFIALPDIQARQFGSAAITALVVGISSYLVVAFVSVVISLFLIDFVVPIMYLRHIGVLAAWGEFRSSMLPGNVGTFVLYVFFKILIAIPFLFLMTMLICCTFCLGAIPYVGTHVLMLPMHVFWRSYPLYFIEQFGPEWRIFSTADEVDTEFADADDWEDERFRPGDERIRPADDLDRPPDDRFRPE